MLMLIRTWNPPVGRVGGGKPKMRWYFGQHGWPASAVLGGAVPATPEQQDLLIDTLQDWKTEKYKEIVGAWRWRFCWRGLGSQHGREAQAARGRLRARWAEAGWRPSYRDRSARPHAPPAGSGQVAARPGVLALMDEARGAGLPVAVCSAATKSAVEFVLCNLLGQER